MEGEPSWGEKNLFLSASSYCSLSRLAHVLPKDKKVKEYGITSMKVRYKFQVQRKSVKTSPKIRISHSGFWMEKKFRLAETG